MIDSCGTMDQSLFSTDKRTGPASRILLLATVDAERGLSAAAVLTTS